VGPAKQSEAQRQADEEAVGLRVYVPMICEIMRPPQSLQNKIILLHL
jgi:hypothetical protein